MRRNVFALFFLSFLFVCHPASYAAEVFTADLRFEVAHPEVRILQKFLNIDPATRLAISGAGSPGFETEFFGARTLSAVLRFQAKYWQEIGLPNADAGSGALDFATRGYLNTIVKLAPVVSNSTNQIIAPPISNPSSSSADYGAWLNSPEMVDVLKQAGLTPDYFVGDNWKKYPHILSISPSVASPGDKVTISGINLDDPSLQLVLDGQNVAFTKIAANTFQFIVPESLAFGYREVSFQKNGGAFVVGEMGMTIKKKGALAPTITKVVRAGSGSISINEKLSVEGKGFAAKNDIVTSFGIIKDVSASGTNLSFSFSELPNASDMFASFKNSSAGTPATVPMAIFIRNENGASNAWGPIYIMP